MTAPKIPLLACLPAFDVGVGGRRGFSRFGRCGPLSAARLTPWRLIWLAETSVAGSTVREKLAGGDIRLIYEITDIAGGAVNLKLHRGCGCGG
jgi:hypothetical protein